LDINTLRGLATLVLLIAFIGMCFWVYSSKRKKSYDDAAHLPFADDDDDDKNREEKSKRQ